MRGNIYKLRTLVVMEGLFDAFEVFTVFKLRAVFLDKPTRYH